MPKGNLSPVGVQEDRRWRAEPSALTVLRLMARESVAPSGALVAAGNVWHMNDGTVADQNRGSATVSSRATLSLFVVVFGFDTTLNCLSYSTRGHDCHESHPLLLILAERLVERLPAIRDFLEVGRTLTMPRPALHEFDRIALGRASIGPLSRSSATRSNRGARTSMGPDGILHGRPVFFLVGCRLQGGLDHCHTSIRQAVEVCGTRMRHSDSARRRFRCIGKR